MSSFLQKALGAFCILLLILLPAISASEETESLEMVHVLYRHGDRSPIAFYPTDHIRSNAHSVWPEGLGQLTKIGKEMEYNLGSWLRNRYKTFVSKVFRPEEMSVLSTDVDRTLMSAQCVLASFYNPDKETMFIDGLSWTPSPIRTTPVKFDMILNVESSCPRLSYETENLKYNTEIKKFHEKHKDIFENLSNMSGLKLNTVLDVDMLFDTLRIEKIYNQSIPKWASERFNEMQEISDYSFKFNTFTHELKRLRGGPLLGVITDNMIKKSHGKIRTKKMQMFSAHDTTIANLLNTMDIYNDISPPYAATVLVELYQKNATYFVKTFYQNDSSMASPPHELTIPGCTFECPLDKWADLLSDVTPKDWSKECYRPDPVMDHYIIVSLSCLCGIIGAIIAIVGGWYGYRRWRERSLMREGYEPLEENPVAASSPYGSIC